VLGPAPPNCANKYAKDDGSGVFMGAFMETFFAGPPADYAPPKLQVHIVRYDGKSVRCKSNVFPSSTPRNAISSFSGAKPAFQYAILDTFRWSAAGTNWWCTLYLDYFTVCQVIIWPAQ